MEHLILAIIAVIGSSFHVGHVVGLEVPRIRGISISVSSLYTPNLNFDCIDGSRKIMFNQVNDDYCDCGDGSDEPGTAACSNGSFFCQNSGYKPLRIPSARVNDGICDCCDGTDEYASGEQCVDICQQLERESNAVAEKAAELSREGSKIRLEMIEQGKKLRNEYIARLKKLKTDYQEAELSKLEKEMIKNVAEEREKVALSKYNPQEADATQVAKEHIDNVQEIEIEQHFKMLDKDESGTVTMFELQLHSTFDKDHNGIVTEEEAMYFLGHHDEVNFDEFRDKVWSKIKPFIMRDQGTFEQSSDTNDQHISEQPEPDQHHQYDRVNDIAAEPYNNNNNNNNDDDDDDDDDDNGDNDEDDESANEDNDDHDYQHNSPDGDGELAKSEIEYDEDTQSIVDEANAARTQCHQAEKAVLDLQNEMRNLESKIDRDYGPDDVFAPLDGNCFQYTNFEYVYSMCMYGRTTQSAKSGGSEVLLGHWHDWTGDGNEKYSQMKFTGGSACWNGPTRSSTVDLRCGLENKLVSVAEPTRCTYTMIFETPGVCNVDVHLNETHDEL